MAKKRQNQSSKKVSYQEAIGLSSVFANEKANFTLGITLMAVSIFMLICFISYFTSSADDQSFVLNPMAGDITNTGREFHNSCGSWGAYISHFFIAVCFGLPAFIIPLFTILCSLAMYIKWTYGNGFSHSR